MSRFPFPIPFGWYRIAMSDDIRTGDVTTLRYFGKELVVWRDTSGRVACHEAFCPHLGAYLGQGTNEGDCIRCPFHGWGFDSAGTNVDIPYADKPNRKARLETLPVQEHAGLVLAWYHPHGVAPKWDLLEVPEYDDPEYGDYVIREFDIATCLQEMGENFVDHAHFQFVHGHPRVGITEKVELTGYDRIALTSQEFPSSRGPVPGRIDVFGRGPGFAVTRYQGLVDASLLGTTTPIDEEQVRLTFHFMIRNPDGDERLARIGDAFINSVTNEVGQDIPIWEAKRYNPQPALASSEKPIADFRRWFAQFYAGYDNDGLTPAN